MMNVAATCPERSRWQELLGDALSPREQGELVAHLDTCFKCQETLETLAVSNQPISGASLEVGGEERPLEPAVRQIIDALETRSRVTGAEADGVDYPETPIAFLDPPRSAAYLGRLGRYDVVQVIRRGGMGWVLRAFDEKLNRDVAIKVIAPQFLTSASARQRFAREAHSVGTIRSPHVIDVYSAEETAAGVPYLVMEYVAGMSLQDRLDAGGRLELRDILRIGAQTAKGLAAAHERGLIHRDIKPGNILLSDDTGLVKVTDFGLARAVDDASLTQSGVAAGTPQYMSPEQARSEPVDHRGDLFSLGSVLYAICTGKPPFAAKGNLAVLNQVCDASPQPIQAVNPDIPDWLVQVIGKLHAKAPGDRYQTAAEVAQALEGYPAHVQEPERMPLPAPERVRRRFGRVPAALIALLMVFAVTEGLGITNLGGVVIRIFTPDGILVVDVDDPAIKVTIEDNGKEVVVNGPGIQEVRLRTGDHKIQATRDGKALALPNDVVTITRGDKQVVRVRRDDNPPIQPQLLFDQAVSLYERGVKLRDKNAEEGERILRQAVDILTRLQADSPGDARYRQQMDSCRWILGSTLNLQAYRKVINPNVLAQDLERGLALSQEAVKLIPNDGGVWINLAIGQYRAKDWKSALATAEKSMALRQGGTGNEWFFVAMIQWQLGERDKAREYYDRAVVWTDKNRPTDKSLLALKAEAAQLLGIAP